MTEIASERMKSIALDRQDAMMQKRQLARRETELLDELQANRMEQSLLIALTDALRREQAELQGATA